MAKFIWIIGPQAVGKMTVAKSLVAKTDYKFFHNHQSIEFALQYYPHGSKPFRKLDNGIRQLMFDTVSEYEDRGLGTVSQ